MKFFSCLVKNDHLQALALLFFLLTTYIFFQSPGLTGGDSGDLVAAATLRGVAHPPGYPLYTFLGWLLTRLPIGPTTAYLVGYLSSVPAAISVIIAFLIAKEISQRFLVALVSSLSLAFNYLFWLQAEIQEVFALHLLFLFLTLYLVILWIKRPRARLVFPIALIVGLEFSHHHTYVLVLPALAYVFLINRQTKIKRSILTKKFILTLFLFFLLGAMFYLYVFFAPATNSLVNWGPVGNLGEWLVLVTRSVYGTFAPMRGVAFSIRSGLVALLAFSHFLYQEFTALGIFLILLGVFRLYKTRKALFHFTLIWFVFTGLFFQLYAGYPLTDWFFLATVERFYLLPYPALFIWLTFGLDCARREIEKLAVRSSFFSEKMKTALPSLGILLFILYPGYLFFINFRKNDLRGFYEFDKFGERLLNSCPRDSFLMTVGDIETFSPLYVHGVKGVRPDLRLINMYMPQVAVSYFEELSGLRRFFEKGRSPEGFWVAFKQHLIDNRLTFCTTEEINLGEDYLSFPQGLVNVYTKELKEKDDELIFEANLTAWEDYWKDFPAEDEPVYEAFFTRDLLENYCQRLLAISKYFFARGEHEKAEFWLGKAESCSSKGESILRMKLLIDIKQGKCDLAREKMESYRPVFEEARTWPLTEAVYEKECLGNDENYQRLLEEMTPSLPVEKDFD